MGEFFDYDEGEVYQQLVVVPIDIYQLPYDNSIELDARFIHKLSILLGQGAFGDVWLGCLLNDSGTLKETVAIKTPRNAITTEEDAHAARESIRAEIKILSHVGEHQNVLRLKGALTTKKDQFWMATEYCQFGSMKTFLASKKENSLFINEITQREQRYMSSPSECSLYKANIDKDWMSQQQKRLDEGFVTTSDLFDFALQIAAGMDFLQGKGIVHRDLALRNILLAEHLTVKIADFGLSREILNGYYKYTRTANNELAVPFFTTAPESLKTGKAFLESDWWTYGIVLWELFELGATPYAGLTTAANLLSFLEQGRRLPKPEYAPYEVFHLMTMLWNMDPQKRPSLSVCKETLSRQLALSRPIRCQKQIWLHSPNGTIESLLCQEKTSPPNR